MEHDSEKPDRLYQTYQTIDTLMLKATNGIVGAWNWTTGGTRLELANTLETAGAICAPLGGILDSSIMVKVASVPLIPVSFFLAKYFINRNKSIEEWEEHLANSNGLSIELELMKTQYQLLGPTFLGVSAYQANIDMHPLVPIASTSMGLAKYVMRANYVPPRKNFLARGLDTLIETLRRHSPTPQPVPA